MLTGCTKLSETVDFEVLSHNKGVHVTYSEFQLVVPAIEVQAEKEEFDECFFNQLNAKSG